MYHTHYIPIYMYNYLLQYHILGLAQACPNKSDLSQIGLTKLVNPIYSVQVLHALCAWWGVKGVWWW